MGGGGGGIGIEYQMQKQILLRVSSFLLTLPLLTLALALPFLTSIAVVSPSCFVRTSIALLRHNWKITNNDAHMAIPTWYCTTCSAYLVLLGSGSGSGGSDGGNGGSGGGGKRSRGVGLVGGE